MRVSSSYVVSFREEVSPWSFHVSHSIKDNAVYIVGAHLLKEHWRESKDSQVHKEVRQHG